MSVTFSKRELMELIERASVNNDGDDICHRVTCLSMFGRLVTTLPTTIVVLRHLTKLNVGCTSLRALPAEIGSLSSLLELSVNHNQLTSLPREIGELRSLVTLFAHNNNLRSLPIELCELHALETLCISHNEIPSLPREINRLQKLRDMFVDNNLLRALPMRSLDALVNLKFMTFTLNPFDDMSPLLLLDKHSTIFQRYRVARVLLGATLLALLASRDSLYRFALPVCERMLRPFVSLMVDNDDLLQCIYSMHMSCRRVFDARGETHKNT